MVEVRRPVCIVNKEISVFENPAIDFPTLPTQSAMFNTVIPQLNEDDDNRRLYF